MRAIVLALTLFLLAACQRNYRVGDEVMVEWDGKDYPAVILTTEGPAKFKVHFIGFDDAWDETIPKSRIKALRTGKEPQPEPPAKVRQKAMEAAQSNTFRVGDHVRVEWRGRLYPAQIIDVAGKERYKVRFEGYGSEFDEIVGLNRVQPK